jgi:hypothetical protein
MERWDVSLILGLTFCKRWEELLGCGRSYIGRINCMGWPELMDGIKIMVLSIWSISCPNIEKRQAGITRKRCVRDLDPKVQQRRGCYFGRVWYAIYSNNRE